MLFTFQADLWRQEGPLHAQEGLSIEDLHGRTDCLWINAEVGGMSTHDLQEFGLKTRLRSDPDPRNDAYGRQTSSQDPPGLPDTRPSTLIDVVNRLV